MIRHNVPGYQGRTVTPQYTVIHHTAGTNSLHICKYGRTGLPGPLCQYLIAKDGTVHHITDGYANHVGQAKPGFSNYNCIGVELENLGNGVDPYPAEQMESARELCRALGLPVVGHKEICSPPGRKIDPSFDMDAFRASLSLPTEQALTEEQKQWLEGRFNLIERYIGDTQNLLRLLLGDLDADKDAQVAQIMSAIAAVNGPEGVDAQAVATAVADKIAARMAN